MGERVPGSLSAAGMRENVGSMAATTMSSLSMYEGFPVVELLEDFRVACTSRAIDDRELSLQKQSRMFFQIAGAGHEALLLGPGPQPAAGLRLVLPLLPRPGPAPRSRGVASPAAAAGGGVGR